MIDYNKPIHLSGAKCGDYVFTKDPTVLLGQIHQWSGGGASVRLVDPYYDEQRKWRVLQVGVRDEDFSTGMYEIIPLETSKYEKAVQTLFESFEEMRDILERIRYARWPSIELGVGLTPAELDKALNNATSASRRSKSSLNKNTKKEQAELNRLRNKLECIRVGACCLQHKNKWAAHVTQLLEDL